MTSNEQPANNAVEANQMLEGRVTGLERDMSHMSQAVSSLAETVNTGFNAVHESLEGSSRRQDERTSELHARLDKQNERGRWNPGLTLAAITCAMVIGGIFVAFVNMTTQPLAKDDVETRTTINQHVMLDAHPGALALAAKMNANITDHQLEIEKLHSITDELLADLSERAEAHGYMRAQMDAVQRQLYEKTDDRFFGREGTALSERITELEKFIREQHGNPK